MKLANVMKTGVVSLALLFAAGTAAYAEDAVNLQTNQNTQLQTQQRMGPAVPQGDGSHKQVQHKKMHQHQNKFEKQLQKAENVNRGTAMGMGANSEQRVGNRSGSQGSGSMNRSGGGGGKR